MNKIYDQIDKIEKQLESVKNIVMKSANEHTLQTRSKDFVIEKDVSKEKIKS